MEEEPEKKDEKDWRKSSRWTAEEIALWESKKRTVAQKEAIVVDEDEKDWRKSSVWTAEEIALWESKKRTVAKVEAILVDEDERPWRKGKGEKGKGDKGTGKGGKGKGDKGFGPDPATVVYDTRDPVTVVYDTGDGAQFNIVFESSSDMVEVKRAIIEMMGFPVTVAALTLF